MLFSATLAPMWFTPEIEQESPFAETAVSAELSPQSAQQRLSEIESEYQVAAQGFDNAWNALRQHESVGLRLSAALDHARVTRARLLQERANLLRIVEDKK